MQKIFKIVCFCLTHTYPKALGKPQIKFVSVHLGIAQIAIGPPSPHSNGHSVAPIFGQNHANARLYMDISPKNRCQKTDNAQMNCYIFSVELPLGDVWNKNSIELDANLGTNLSSWRRYLAMVQTWPPEDGTGINLKLRHTAVTGMHGSPLFTM